MTKEIGLRLSLTITCSLWRSIDNPIVSNAQVADILAYLSAERIGFFDF